MKATIASLALSCLLAACTEQALQSSPMDQPPRSSTTATSGGETLVPGTPGTEWPNQHVLVEDGAVTPGVVPPVVHNEPTCSDFCAAQSPSGLLLCDDFSILTKPRQFLPCKNMPSLTMSISDCSLVFEKPSDFSASYAVLGNELDYRNTSVEVTVRADTEVRSLSSVSWGDPSNLINIGLQRDEGALYLHLVVGGDQRARLSAPVRMTPGQNQRVMMEVWASGLIRGFVDNALVLETTQNLSGLPALLAPGVSTNAYPPNQRFTFDDFVVRRLAQSETTPR
jgi:hypothetical protein